MKVLAYFPNHFDPPSAMFWVDDRGQIQSVEHDRPENALAHYTVSQKFPWVSWSDFFDRLVERNPDLDNWETFTVKALTPKELLDLLSRISA